MLVGTANNVKAMNAIVEAVIMVDTPWLVGWLASFWFQRQ